MPTVRRAGRDDRRLRRRQRELRCGWHDGDEDEKHGGEGAHGPLYTPRPARGSPRTIAGVIERGDIERAAEVVRGRLHRTLLSSDNLGPDTFLRPELFQKTGSFKPRGMLNKVASLSPPRRRGIVTWSAGNAAQGAAFAAAAEGSRARFSCGRRRIHSRSPRRVATAPRSTSTPSPAEAHDRLLAYVEETGRTFVHPFDDPVLQAGHGTLGLEVVEDIPDVATMVVPIGGGGLIAGVASAVDCRVVGVEPRRAVMRRRSEAGDRFASSRAPWRTASMPRSRAPARSRSAASASTRSCS